MQIDSATIAMLDSPTETGGVENKHRTEGLEAILMADAERNPMSREEKATMIAGYKERKAS